MPAHVEARISHSRMEITQFWQMRNNCNSCLSISHNYYCKNTQRHAFINRHPENDSNRQGGTSFEV
jgi:hypothetical protein